MANQRLHLAQGIALQLRTFMRHTAPDDAHAADWEEVIDVDTNEAAWFPKSLYDEYQRL